MPEFPANQKAFSGFAETTSEILFLIYTTKSLPGGPNHFPEFALILWDYDKAVILSVKGIPDNEDGSGSV